MFSFSKSQKIDFLRMALTLFAITAVVGVLLAVVHHYTEPVVERSAEERLELSLRELISDAEYFEEVEEFEKSVTLGNVSVPVQAVYSAKGSGDQSLGYCVRVAPKGYSDIIDLLVAIDQDGAVKSVQILSISDTPGIGMKVESNETFQSSMYGLTDSAKIVKTTPTVKEEIQVIAGATVSSAAYINGVNAAIEVVQMLRLEV